MKKLSLAILAFIRSGVGCVPSDLRRQPGAEVAATKARLEEIPFRGKLPIGLPIGPDLTK